MSKPKVDTIAALSTPAGLAALGVVRLSGPDTYKILNKTFKYGGKRSFPLPYSVYYGKLIDNDTQKSIDNVVVSCYLAPNSYTGEDCAEITAHGNPVIISKILALLFNNGARQAEAGEFTRRAFFNGKMDLLDVEATSNILAAKTSAQAEIALNQLSGLPSKRIAKFRNDIIEHLVQLEASLNFPEDAIEAIDEKRLARDLKKILEEIKIFADNAKNGSLIADGLKIALIGKPNAGKSSLLNRLLGRERAIVTEIAGTTRDTLEESFQIGKFPVKLIDTAGLRNSGDTIEKIGIERTNSAIKEAFMVIGVFDGSSYADEEDERVFKKLKSVGVPFVCIRNKSDLPKKLSDTFFEGEKIIDISAKTGEGINKLILEMKNIINELGTEEFDNLVLLGAAQTQALNKALTSLTRAAEGAGVIYQDMLAIELEESVRELGKITGETVDVNTLDLIFERFCIGK